MAIEVADIRPEVLEFAKAMEEKLRSKDKKGGWRGCSKTQLIGMLIRETVELLASSGFDPSEVVETVRVYASKLDQHDFTSDPALEAVDVANFSMMLFDNITNGRYP
jgi:hypothetical protein